jgi:hypothetical protein
VDVNPRRSENRKYYETGTQMNGRIDQSLSSFSLGHAFRRLRTFESPAIDSPFSGKSPIYSSTLSTGIRTLLRQKEAGYLDKVVLQKKWCALALSAVVMSMTPLEVVTSLPNENQTDFGTSEKVAHSKTDVESTAETDAAVLRNERDIVTHVVSIHDDPSLNPWTFRSFFIGIGLSAFGGILGGCYFCSREPHQLMNCNK